MKEEHKEKSIDNEMAIEQEKQGENKIISDNRYNFEKESYNNIIPMQTKEENPLKNEYQTSGEYQTPVT
jgi:hypothetical protein